MNKLYAKSEITFSILWIIIYVVGASVADGISESIGPAKSVTVIVLGAMSAVAVMWLRKNELTEKYGLCKGNASAKQFLYYIPLIFFCSGNLWYGVRMNMDFAGTMLYIASMVFVGFLEELIFRGFLFVAMCRDSVKSALIVSSVTFGIGHIVNLINGSGADVISNMCQVVSAVAFGFLFATIFLRAKTLYPCIASHITINVLSAFSNEAFLTDSMKIFNALILSVTAIMYTIILTKTLPYNKG